MASFADRLLEKRAAIYNEAKEILELAVAENRDLSAGEQERYDRAMTDMAELRERADKFVADEASAKAAEESLRGLATRPEPKFEARDLGAEFRALARGEISKIEVGESFRALSKGTATAGGNTVPTTFNGRLWEHLIETATLLRGGATVWTTNSGENIDQPITTSHGAAAAVAEAGTLAGTDPAFSKRTLGAFKFGQLILLSKELVEDTGVDIEGYIARAAGWGLGNAFGQKLVVGVGSTEPTGIFNNTTLGVTSGTGVAGVPTFDNLIDLLYSVTTVYRNRPSTGWLIKDSTASTLRKIKDTTNQYIWQPSVVAGQPDRLLGYPIYTDPYVAATGVNNKSVAFGDLSAYVVRVVNGVRFERSDEFKFDTDQIAYRAILRGDGLLVDQTGAVKHFVGAAT